MSRRRTAVELGTSIIMSLLKAEAGDFVVDVEVTRGVGSVNAVAPQLHLSMNDAQRVGDVALCIRCI